MSDTTEPTILVRKQGRIGRLTLNRPKALNALDSGMVDAIADALALWGDDPAVHAVVLEGAGGRAFCAGGDIRALRSLAASGQFDAIERFFTAEYALNRTIAHYPKPYISLIDGICMGGGIGLSVHGSIRVATEAAQFAMPETAIGLFPDVGATFLLPRLRGHWGMLLGLAGTRVVGADAVWLGLATHLVSREVMAGLADALAEDGVAALSTVALPVVPGPDMAHPIDAFGLGSVDAIVAALAAQPGAWAAETLATLQHVSPSSVLWTFEALRRGARQTLEQCQTMELALTRRAVRHPDFLEGVRAMVVDKDRTPRWSPATYAEIDPSSTAAMFAG